MANAAKIKVLWYGELFSSTGFGNVSRNIINQLIASGEYDIDVVAPLYYGAPYDHEKWPIRVWPGITPSLGHIPQYADPLGRQKTIDLLETGEYDIFFTLTDVSNTESFGANIVKAREKLVKKFKWISYSPIDWTPQKKWIDTGIALSDYPVLYTQYGFKEVRKLNDKIFPRVIPHGIDLSTFFPMSEKEIKEFRKAYFGEKNVDKFIITNLNRNNARKDVARTIAAFSLFHKNHPESLLYLHMEANDNGGLLPAVVEEFGLKVSENVFFPGGFKWDIGYAENIINGIYNASDLIVTTTQGEGWGLSLTESMATKTPVVAPENTSIPEILGNGDRGWLVPAGDPIDYWVVHEPNDLVRICPIVSVTKFSETMDKAYQHITGGLVPKDNSKVEKAYEWVQSLSWGKVGKQWLDLFQEAHSALLKEKWSTDTKPGRNEPCPCGSGKKWKVCHGQ